MGPEYQKLIRLIIAYKKADEGSKESVMGPEYQKLIRLIIAYKKADEGSVYEKEYMNEIKSIIKPLFAKGDISQ